MTSIEWNKGETDLLVQVWSSTSKVEDILHLFPSRNKEAIQRRAYYLRLSKSKEVLAAQSEARKALLLKRNKEMGRDLSEEMVRSISKQFKTKKEFIENDNSAYITARNMGIIDEVTSHMLPIQSNYPQTFLYLCVKEIFPDCTVRYNDRKVISPKEIDVYVVEKKIGFEYDGMGWHQNTQDKDKEKDQICEEKGIRLIRIKELRKYNQEKFIVPKLIEAGFDMTTLDIKNIKKNALQKNSRI